MSIHCTIATDQEVRRIGAHETIEQVIAEHRLHRDDFFGRYRDTHLVAARRDAARRLTALGFSSPMIARIMKRNRTTILGYLPHLQETKKARYAAKRIIDRLAPDMAALVVAFAKAEEISVEQIIVRWVADRAEGEAHALLRGAA